MNSSENLPTDNNNKSIVKGQTMYNWETRDNQDKVILDSINAIEKRREHMTDEQLRKAYTELQTGLGPDIYSQLCGTQYRGTDSGRYQRRPVCTYAKTFIFFL